MTTQTKLSNPSDIAQEPMVKRYLSQVLVAITSLIIGLILGIFVTNLTTTATEIAMQPAAERVEPSYSRGPTLAEYTVAVEENKASEQRAIEAETARYTSLGLFYAAGNEADVQRAIEAEAARYSAMAKFYLTEDEANIQRAIEAETARYNGLVKFYGAKDRAHSLAWPPRPTQFHIAENAVMPIAENGADADGDIGLMEFSTSNESSPQPVIEADADRDIGLMEFLAVPNETHSQKAGTLLELHNK